MGYFSSSTYCATGRRQEQLSLWRALVHAPIRQQQCSHNRAHHRPPRRICKLSYLGHSIISTKQYQEQLGALSWRMHMRRQLTWRHHAVGCFPHRRRTTVTCLNGLPITPFCVANAMASELARADKGSTEHAGSRKMLWTVRGRYRMMRNYCKYKSQSLLLLFPPTPCICVYVASPCPGRSRKNPIPLEAMPSLGGCSKPNLFLTHDEAGRK